MLGRGLTVLLSVLAVAGAALAQRAVLTAEESRAELFGVELGGVNETYGDSWRECIEPSGRTIYERRGVRREGRLRILDDGQACFHYGEDSYESCFVVEREGEHYRFQDFVTRVVRRGVTDCGPVDGSYVALPRRDRSGH